jgi:polyisoprenoid-binding protein YceI
MRRPLVIGLVAAFLLLLVAAGGGYLYFSSNVRSAPKPLALSAASASPTQATPSPSTSSNTLAGRWTVAQGSQAGYRVKEQFVDQSSPHEAVARTSSVSGDLSLQGTGADLQASGLTFTAQLAGLQSVDQVAGRDVRVRDGIVGMSLGVQTFPTATFQAQTVSVPSDIGSGAPATLTIPGRLTIHGTTRDVQASVQAQLVGNQVQVAGSIATAMTDFGVQPPRVGFVTVQPQVTIEFQLQLSKA